MKLLAEYGSLENVLENVDKIGGKMGEKIKAGRDNAILSKQLATIITDVPVTFHEEDFCLKAPDKEKLTSIFNELEFKSLGKRILGDTYGGPDTAAKPRVQQTDLFGQVIESSASSAVDAPLPVADEPAVDVYRAENNISNTAHDYKLADTPEEMNALLQVLMQHAEVSFDTETTGTDPNNVSIVGLSFSVKKGEGWYVPTPDDREGAIAVLQAFKPLFDREDVIIIGQNIKYDMIVLKWYGFSIKGKLFDTMLAHYLIEPEGRRSMDLLSAQYLQYEPVHIEELIGKKGKGQGNMRDVETEKIKDYAAEDADITLQLKEKFAPILHERSVAKVFYDIETPLVNVLTDMEFEGIKVDINVLQDYSRELETEINRAEESVYSQAGVRFNLGSPKQLGEVLFEKMQLDPKAKKTRTGQYATGEDVLAKIANKHQIVEDILVYRELTKLKSTYVDALPLMINKRTGRIHTSYNQAVAVTGRLSSNNPNLQNIPIRTDRGREVRKAFVPRDADHMLVSADYSQIELRIIAAISEDAEMISAFRQGLDIHAATAAKVYGVEMADVTSDMRRNAKSVNFGIIYGVSAFGLSENLGIARSEAKTLIDNYFAQYPAIKSYMEDQVASAQRKGYVETLLGRKRWLKDINSSNAVVRGYAERNAINMPIQGTAADMIKLAMISIHDTFKKEGLRSRMILQVHDELVFDVHQSELEIVKPLILDGMRNAMPLAVPIESEIGVGANWLQAH